MRTSVLMASMGLSAFAIAQDGLFGIDFGFGDDEADVDPPVTIADDFLLDGCKPFMIFFARGSTEPGNIGDAPGPQTIDGLKAALGAENVAAQGFQYDADILDNLKDGGCDEEDAAGLASLISQGARDCPDSGIFASGYSQGAALVHRAMEQLTEEERTRILAVVTFGDTQFEQDGGLIPGIPADRSLIICHDGDLVCEDTLIVTPDHSGYEVEAPLAVDFMVGKT